MWFENYLRGRKQMVVASEGKSVWSSIGRGVPQGSILGLLLFTDGLPAVVKQCTVNLYADETTLYCCCRDPQEVKYALEADLEAVANWIDANNLKMNIGKTQLVILCRNRWSNECDNLVISYRGVDIARKGSSQYLGVTMDSQLKRKVHIQHVRQKCFMSLSKLWRVSHFLPTPTRVKIYNALVLPHLDYCCVLWHSCGSVLTQKVEQIQIITSSSSYTPSETLRSSYTGWHCHNDERCSSYRFSTGAYTVELQSTFAQSSHWIGKCNMQELEAKITSTWRGPVHEFQASLLWNQLPSELKELTQPLLKGQYMHTRCCDYL